MSEITVKAGTIPGLLSINLAVHGDSRGWFKENFQRAKLEAAGFPQFDPVQNNISYNAEIGVTRGIHAEPWDKYISLASGRIFAAIVDLRSGHNFGKLETFELTPSEALFVPRGCGNSFQTLETNVVYTYLVNGHWSADAHYTHVNLFDRSLAISWPIPRDKAIVSEKDAGHPFLTDRSPVD